ncbi:MAG: hypothetical protein MI862_12700 [Desulfobacterales bacterium]|nr:hypothetical protein [Desulfobacterales bacterium]
MNHQPMTPRKIINDLSTAGYTQVRVADECSVSQPFIHQVIYGTSTSHRVRCFIANVIDRSVEEIWDVKNNPSKVGRPSSRTGHQAA